jgi:hypothetical protein
VRRICADLLAVRVSVSDDEVVPALLAGLPTAYGMVVTVIESSEEELTVAAVVTKLLNTEARIAREETAEAHGRAAEVHATHGNSDLQLLCQAGPPQMRLSCSHSGRTERLAGQSPHGRSGCPLLLFGF